MHKHVESVIGRLATDPRLLSQFGEDPLRTLRLLQDQGLELTEIEVAALASADPAAVFAFAQSLDRRLRKAASTHVRNEEEENDR